MKHIALLLVFFALAGCSPSDPPAPNEQPKIVTESRSPATSVARPARDPDTPVSIYPFKSGRFAFRIMGPDIESGTMTVIVDEHGNLESKRSEKIMKNGIPVEIWTIKKGYELYSISTDKQEVIVARLPERKSAAIDLEALIREHGSPEAADAYLNDRGIRLLPEETIHGYDCQVYEQTVNDVILTRWIHRGIELRMAYRRNGGPAITTRDLIHANFDENVDPGYFTIPSGFKVKRY